MKSFKTLTALLLAALSVAGVGYLSVKLASDQTGQSPRPVRVAAYSGEQSLLVYLAEQQGYFKNQGLEVSIQDFPTGKVALEALLSGDADIATASDFVFVSYSFEHSDLSLIGTVSTQFQLLNLIVLNGKGFRTPQDLKGRTIGTIKKSSAEFALGNVLALNQLSVQDVTIVDLQPENALEALEQGAVDAVFIWEPYVYYAKTELGDKAISWSEQASQDRYFLLIARKQWVDQNPLVVRRFLKAITQAERYAKEDFTGLKEVLKNKFNYKDDYIAQMLPKINLVVRLPQAVILTMEDQARWRIENELTQQTQIPNYLNLVYVNGLKSIKPEAVEIVK